MDPNEPPRASGGLTRIVMACAVIGAAAVGVALYAGPSVGLISDDQVTVPAQEAPPAGAPAPLSERMKTPRKPGPAYATEDYGRRLIASTAELLGPDQPDEALRYIDSRLNCGSCHLGTGTEPGTLTLLQTDEHYPRFSGRAGTQTDIEDRINECMQRSMNGRPLPMESAEMIAMAAYLRGLGTQYLGHGHIAPQGRGTAAVEDADAGRQPRGGTGRLPRAMRAVSRDRRPGPAGDHGQAEGVSLPAALGT